MKSLDQGLSSVGRRDQKFFDVYKDRRDECHKLAKAIRDRVTAGVVPPPPDDEGAE